MLVSIAIFISASIAFDPLPPTPRGVALPSPPLIEAPLPPTNPACDPPPTRVVLQRFTITRDGELLIIPVTVEGKRRNFVLDTGCTLTALDLKLLAGEPFDRQIVSTAGDNTEVPFYHPPKTSVGQLGFDGVTRVAGLNLAPVRTLSHQSIDGLLGNDFLGRHVVEIDFETGELSFLKTPAPISGIRIPIDWVDGVPRITARVPGGDELDFILDTGLDSASTVVDANTYKKLTAQESVRDFGISRAFTAGGPIEQRTGLLSRLRGNGFHVPEMIISEGPRPLLGLGFLSQFLVTFDFPRSAVYLQPRAGYPRAQNLERTGFRLAYRDGQLLGHYIVAKSPANKPSSTVVLSTTK